MGSCSKVEDNIICIYIFKIADQFYFLNVLKGSQIRNLAVARNKADVVIICRLDDVLKINFICEPGTKAGCSGVLSDYKMKIGSSQIKID